MSDLAFFEGLRVVELGSWMAAPGASAMLADLGAQVLKVEPPSGDPSRNFVSSIGGRSTLTPSFALFNRHKRSVVLDLGEKADRAWFDGLLADSDVLVTNLLPGGLERIGLSPDAVLTRYPSLVYASITGLGLRGPDRDRPSYDVGAFWSRSGLLHQLTRPGTAPVGPTGGYGDLVTSLALTSGILAALLERQVTGRGRLVETSLLQTGAWVNGGDLAVQASLGRVRGVSARDDTRTPLVNSYRAGDGRWFFLLGVESARHLPAVARAIGRPELVEDERFATAKSIRANRRELIAILDDAFGTDGLEHWAGRLDAEGVWWQVVQTPAETLADAQLAANQMLHDVVVDRACPMVTAPFTIRGHQPASPGRAPELGEHEAVR
jgi:crotonobetainyl-CoA:carnitine CoA-transferase CaiB-like acyl-CoA transferase